MRRLAGCRMLGMMLSASARATLLPLLVVSLALSSHTGTATAQGKGKETGKQGRRSLHTAPTVTRSGDVAVIEDDGSLFVPPNRAGIDLAGHGIDFKRRKDGLRATMRSSAPIKTDLGSKLDIKAGTSFGRNASVFVKFPAGFEFPFFGSRYDGVYVNSDGNLTFTQPDAVFSDANSVARVLTGPPRIAPLFFDLDPSEAQQREGPAGPDASQRGIYSKLTAKSLQITWWRVPGPLRFVSLDDPATPPNQNTFQVTLFKNGRILIAYGELALMSPGSIAVTQHRSAVVGVAPGGGGELELLDFTADLPVATTTAALLERFNKSPVLDDQAVAQAFYRRFADVYDQLIVWLDFEWNTPVHALLPSNSVQGIGRQLYDHSVAYGSDGKLRGYAQMGGLTRYSLDPAEDICNGFCSYNTWGAVAHAVGHRWVSYVRFRDAEGKASDLLRGIVTFGPGLIDNNDVHWSNFLDSDASVIGGYDLRDNGEGFFTTIAASERYSPLDRYLMGLIPAQKVGDISLVTVVSGLAGFLDGDGINHTFEGTRLDLSIDDIIAIEGERVPSSKDAPKRFKMAFIVVGREGEPPSKASIDKVNKIRKRWGPYFRKASVNGTVTTKLVEKS